MRLRRLLTAVATAVAVVVFPAGPVAADPAGPTDYLTEIVAVEPAEAGIELDVLGGDSFLRLVAEPGTEVLVVGYQGEPYLWFRDDGSVLENRNSPTTYQNEERYGSDAPSFASADAEPDWVEVADDGSYAWHDHRAHWMQTIRPAGKQPGDQILEAVVPLVVDGVDVDVTVASTWQAEPSPTPLIVGLIVGLAAATGAVLVARRRGPWPAVLLPVAVLATVVGWIDYTSLPAETGTPLYTWLLPASALALWAVAVALRPSQRFWAAAAGLAGGVQLLVWVWTERDGVGAAILPTNGPEWLHRASVSAAALAGLAGLALGARALAAEFRPADGPAAAPTPV